MIKLNAAQLATVSSIIQDGSVDALRRGAQGGVHMHVSAQEVKLGAVRDDEADAPVIHACAIGPDAGDDETIPAIARARRSGT